MKYSPLWAASRLTRFYRENSPLELLWARTTYSQFGEDVFLRSLFFRQDTGFYVDVGAYHPFALSNTHIFYKSGWRGINIEPNPKGMKLLKRFRKRDTNLSVAISETAGTARFAVDTVYSGIADSRYLFKERNRDKKTIEVQTLPLRAVLAEHVPADTVIDFLSVDCEGHDEVVLRSNDWDVYRPRVVLVEDHAMKIGTPVDTMLAEVGYHYYCRLHLTKVFLSETEAPGHLSPASIKG